MPCAPEPLLRGSDSFGPLIRGRCRSVPLRCHTRPGCHTGRKWSQVSGRGRLLCCANSLTDIGPVPWAGDQHDIGTDAPQDPGATPEPGRNASGSPCSVYLQRHEFLASVTKVISGTGLAHCCSSGHPLRTHHIIVIGVSTARHHGGIPVRHPRCRAAPDMAIVLPRDIRRPSGYSDWRPRINAIVSGVAMAAMVPLGPYLSGLLGKPQVGGGCWRWAITFTYAQGERCELLG